MSDPIEQWKRADGITERTIAGHALVAEIKRLRAVLSDIRDYGAEPGTAAHVMATNGLLSNRNAATQHASKDGSKP